MARAMTAGELTNIRKDNQWAELYMAVHMPDTVWTGRLNGAPSSNDQVNTISVDAGAWGSGYSAAIRDMLMYVGSSAGAYDKGFVRIRENLSGTVTSIDIGEISEIDWADNDYLTIVEEFPIAPRHIRIDTSQVVYMDYDLTYASQSDPHDDPDPVPVIGPSYRVAWLTGASVDVDFDASDTWTFDGTITGHSWTAFPASGVSISGGSTATPTATFTTTGTWRIAYTATGSNGKTWTAYRYVRVFSTADMPIQSFTLDECTGNWDGGGWSARVTLYDEASLSEIRQGSMVCIFAKDFYGNTEVSQGPIADCETILMIGWVGNESINWDPEAGSVTLEIQGPQYWLSQMNGFPSGLEWVASDATTWVDMTTLTLEKGMWHFVHWRTTLTRIIDFQVTDDSRQFALFNASPGTLWDQMTSESFATVIAHPCCDRFGRLFVEVEPQVLTSAERATVPTVLTVTTEDLRRPVNLERRTVPPVGLIDLSGVVYSAGTGSPLFSLAPGHIFKRLGAGIERVDRLALSTQNQANTLAGHFLGWRNAEYPNVSLPFACNMRMIDVTPHQFVSLSVSAGDTIRGISATLTMVPRSVSFTHDPLTGSLLTDVQAESASVEQGSTVGDPPIEPPEPEPPPLPDPDPIPEPDLEPEWPDVCIFPTKAAKVWYTVTFTGTDSASQPTWIELASSGSWPGDDLIRAFGCDISDPFNNMYAITTTARDVIYFNGTTWSTILSKSTQYGNSGDALYCGDTNATAKWLWVDQANGNIYVAVTRVGISVGLCKLYKSTNQGSSWSALSTLVGPSELYGYSDGNMMAYNDYVAVCFCKGAGGTNWEMYYSTNGGSSFNNADSVGSSSFQQRLFVPRNTTELLRRGFAATNFTVFSNAWGATSTQEASDYLWDPDIGDYPLMMWGSPSTVGTYRGVFANDLHVTTDSFNAYTNKGQLQIPGYTHPTTPQSVAGMAYAVQDEDEDMIVYFKQATDASYPESIFVAYGEDDLTPDDKSGQDPATPDGNSIPQSGGGCAYGGPWLFFSTDITLP